MVHTAGEPIILNGSSINSKIQAIVASSLKYYKFNCFYSKYN